MSCPWFTKSEQKLAKLSTTPTPHTGCAFWPAHSLCPGFLWDARDFAWVMFKPYEIQAVYAQSSKTESYVLSRLLLEPKHRLLVWWGGSATWQVPSCLPAACCHVHLRALLVECAWVQQWIITWVPHNTVAACTAATAAGILCDGADLCLFML